VGKLYSLATGDFSSFDNAQDVEMTHGILTFDFDKMKVLQVLEVEQIDNLLLDLSEIHFHVSDELTKYSDSASGMCIKIIYTSGDFLIICSNSNSNFIVEFNSDGNVGNLVVRFTDNKIFVDLTNKFFTV